MDPAILGYCRLGYFRLGVLNPVFERMIVNNQTETVIHQKRTVVGSRDSVTGHLDVTWTDYTIEAVISQGPAGRLDLPPGVSGLLDAVITAVDPLWHLDRIIHESLVFEIAHPPVETRGRKGGFLMRMADLKKLGLVAP